MASYWGRLPVEKVLLVENEQPPKLFRKSNLTDITLLVEGKELHFAKYPLMEGSSVLTQMIENSKDRTRLQLDDVAYSDMIMFLECLHPKTFQSITDTNLEPVATIAHRFKHEGVLNRCEEYIIQQFSFQGNPPDGMYPQYFFHLKVADKYGLKNAVQVGVSSKRVKQAYFSNVISREYGIPRGYFITKGYEDDKNFKQLSFETKFHILSTRLKITEAALDNTDLHLAKKSYLFTK